MKHTLAVKLDPTPEQKEMLRETLTRCNAACSGIALWVHKRKIFNKRQIQKKVYRPVKDYYGLSAQAVVRCIAKVADAYKVGNKKSVRKFRPLAAQPYDARILRFLDDSVSIWVLGGRIKVPLCLGQFQRDRIHMRQGESDLVYRKGKWYLHVTCEVPEKKPGPPINGFLGVDLGVVNIAYDSDGSVFVGDAVELVRRRYAHKRKNLQRKGTRAAKRKLRKIAGREAKFRKDVNHQISRKLVLKAKRTRRGIALEDLKGIRARVTARRRQRARLHSWSFFQLRTYIEYKSKRMGIVVVAVDPRYTSQMCPECGHTERANRRTRDRFKCRACGHAGPADYIAARNIRARAAVNQPNSESQGSDHSISYKLRSSGRSS